MVEWDGLENRCTGNRTVGSNPTLSVRPPKQAKALRGILLIVPPIVPLECQGASLAAFC